MASLAPLPSGNHISPRAALIRFGLLFSALYTAFGTASPFFPAFLSSRHLTADQIGTVLALGSACRLAAGPAAGRLADRLGVLPSVLACCCVLAALTAVALLSSYGFSWLLLLSLCYAAMLAPTTSLADALALRAAQASGAVPHAAEGRLETGRFMSRFEYGWVRGIGSAAFIVGSIAAGQAIDLHGPGTGLNLQSFFLLVAAAVAPSLPGTSPAPIEGRRAAVTVGGGAHLFRIAKFRCVIGVAALILGSHAMHDTYLMILWNHIGISAGLGSVLWAESVAAEVVVFLWLGPMLLRHLPPETGMALAALAAILRWVLTAAATGAVSFALIEPLHGLTFALLHLACMRVIVAIVPDPLAATAQSFYAFGIGAASAALTYLSGWLYSWFGAGGFLVMAGLVAFSLPLIVVLRRAQSASISSLNW